MTSIHALAPAFLHLLPFILKQKVQIEASE